MAGIRFFSMSRFPDTRRPAMHVINIPNRGGDSRGKELKSSPKTMKKYNIPSLNIDDIIGELNLKPFAYDVRWISL
jgi:hypothetical protein